MFFAILLGVIGAQIGGWRGGGGKLVKKLTVKDFVRAARALILFLNLAPFATWSMTCMGVWKLRRLYLLLYIIIINNNNKRRPPAAAGDDK